LSADFPPLPSAAFEQSKTRYTNDFIKYSKEDMVKIVSEIPKEKITKPDSEPDLHKVMVDEPNTELEVLKPYPKRATVADIVMGSPTSQTEKRDPIPSHEDTQNPADKQDKSEKQEKVDKQHEKGEKQQQEKKGDRKDKPHKGEKKTDKSHKRSTNGTNNANKEAAKTEPAKMGQEVEQKVEQKGSVKTEESKSNIETNEAKST